VKEDIKREEELDMRREELAKLVMRTNAVKSSSKVKPEQMQMD